MWVSLNNVTCCLFCFFSVSCFTWNIKFSFSDGADPVFAVAKCPLIQLTLFSWPYTFFVEKCMLKERVCGRSGRNASMRWCRLDTNYDIFCILVYVFISVPSWVVKAGINGSKHVLLLALPLFALLWTLDNNHSISCQSS